MQGHPSMPTEPRQEGGPQSSRALSLGSHTGLCTGRTGLGWGVMASGSDISPTLGHVRGLWPGVHRAFWGPEVEGESRCQSPGYSQCL